MNKSVTEIKVGLDFGDEILSVGRMAIRDQIIYFEYADSFLETGLQLSPFRLPLQKGLIALPARPFEGLAGVFNDSLPDGWGRLLFDRTMRSQGILPSNSSPLDRLAHVGLVGMGALVYEPDRSLLEELENIDLDVLALQSREVLSGNSAEVLRELLALNGSSAGARPKALIDVSVDFKSISHGSIQEISGYHPWLVKFPNFQDGEDAGAVEYVYALMAKSAGVEMPEVHLFPSKSGAGYFAVKRFDRVGNQRLHMHTAAGLLHSDFRTPSLDYEDLLNLTGALTKDVRQVEKMYRLAVFNVLAHNRDDHAKNFSFLMDSSGEWKLSPAYDLTFSSGPGGEQSTMVLGKGKNPGIKDLSKLGQDSNLTKNRVNEILDQTRAALGKWEQLASEFGVSRVNKALISSFIKKID
jgi:serine/threonine-protein kinase HipA